VLSHGAAEATLEVMAHHGDHPAGLVGEQLNTVAFVMDYVEFGFNGPVLRALTGPIVRTGKLRLLQVVGTLGPAGLVFVRGVTVGFRQRWAAAGTLSMAGLRSAG
jgi:hypothetical protein